MVAAAEKASLFSSQFDSNQCREKFVTPLSCLPQSRCNSVDFQTPVHLRLLFDLTHMVLLILWVLYIYIYMLPEVNDFLYVV